MTRIAYVVECLKRNPHAPILKAELRKWSWSRSVKDEIGFGTDPPEFQLLMAELKKWISSQPPEDLIPWFDRWRNQRKVTPVVDGKVIYTVDPIEIEAAARSRGRVKPPKRGWDFLPQAYDTVLRLGTYAKAATALRVSRSTVKSACQAFCKDAGLPVPLPMKAPAPPSAADLERHLRECLTCRSGGDRSCRKLEDLLQALSPDTSRQYVTIGPRPEATAPIEERLKDVMPEYVTTRAYPAARFRPTTSKKPRS